MLGTFALGTAAGDLTGIQLNLGFWPSVLLFAAVISVPAIGWWQFNLNPIVAFWFAYIVTRPLGASFADGFSKPTNGGLGVGDGIVAGIALIVFCALVTWVTIKKIDVQPPAELAPHPREHRSRPAPSTRRLGRSGSRPSPPSNARPGEPVSNRNFLHRAGRPRELRLGATYIRIPVR